MPSPGRAWGLCNFPIQTVAFKCSAFPCLAPQRRGEDKNEGGQLKIMPFKSPGQDLSQRGGACWYDSAPWCSLLRSEAAISHQTTDPQCLVLGILFFAHPGFCKRCVSCFRNMCTPACHRAEGWRVGSLTTIYCSSPPPNVAGLQETPEFQHNCIRFSQCKFCLDGKTDFWYFLLLYLPQILSPQAFYNIISGGIAQ